MYSTNPKAKRLEFRCPAPASAFAVTSPDPTANGYLTWTAMLTAAIDGIQKKIDPGEPLDRDIYDMTPEELEKYPKTPGCLAEALEALEKDHDFLTAGGVFTEDVIETWIEWKRTKELDEIAQRPHPYEFYLYYDS